MFTIEIRYERSTPYESISKQVPSHEIDAFVRSSLRELRKRFRAVGPGFSIYRGCDSDVEQLVEVCVPVKRRSKEVPAGEVAFTTVRGAQCDYPEVLAGPKAVPEDVVLVSSHLCAPFTSLLAVCAFTRTAFHRPRRSRELLRGAWV